jgi:aldose 1-epimerase
MPYRIRTETRTVTSDLDPTVYILEHVGDAGLLACAEVWPALGFNCYRWQVVRSGQPLELLYADPELFNNGRPTRSGIPILFPFPNRIRDGRFSWAGRDYTLPLNDPAQKNAIHGFACRHPWRVLDHGGGDESAWLRASFRCSTDAPECLALWPADHEIIVTWRLLPGILRLEAEIHNPDKVELPFGLGYHPYFRLPFAGSGSIEDCSVEVPAGRFWALEANLPTGERPAVDAARDLNRPRTYRDLHLDDILTDLPARPPRMDGLIERATLHGGADVPLRVFCSPGFRDLVVFTPPHRQAFCVEPYTCTTDAIHLQARGIEAGWLVLPPGGRWQGVVELWV